MPNWISTAIIEGVIVFLFSVLLPIGVLAIREFVRDNRLRWADILKENFPELAKTYSFKYAHAKYANFEAGHNGSKVIQPPLRPNRDGAGAFPAKAGSADDGAESARYLPPQRAVGRDTRPAVVTALKRDFHPFVIPLSIYAVISALGFCAAVGLFDPHPDPHPESTRVLLYGLGKDEVYGHETVAVVVSAFVGAYLWTLIYLGRRVTNYDLTPFSFLRAAIQIALASFVCIALRHLYDALPTLVWADDKTHATPSTPSWLLAIAFLIGFYPALGLNYLQERFSFLHFKTRSSSANDVARELPIDMIDGVDTYIKFRLGEYEIEDIQNLALANPIQIFIETPYPLLEILDWIGQAQLMLEVEVPKILDLRKLNIRTSIDFLIFSKCPGGKEILGNLLYPTSTGASSDALQPMLATFAAKVHVKRLEEIYDIINKATTHPVRPNPESGDGAKVIPLGGAGNEPGDATPAVPHEEPIAG